MMNKPASIDEYISAFPKETQEILELIRAEIKQIAPEAVETISYGIPTFKLNNTYLVYFAGYKSHIGLYPAPIGMKAFEKEFSMYKTGKGSVQFPLDKPMPIDLIHRIVKFRVENSLENVMKKKK